VERCDFVGINLYLFRMDNDLKSRLKFWILVLFSVVAGVGIACIDSSPGWDDSGITAGMIVIGSGISGFVYGKKLWLWALLTGIWIPLHAIFMTGDFAMLLVLLFAFAGSFAGGLLRRAFNF
jgi:hypothetical protein